MEAFDQDNPVIRTIGKIACAWLIGFLWLIACLPVFTVGAATTAMIYAEMKLLNDTGKRDMGTPAANFWKSFRENFRQGTAIGMIYLAAGVLIACGLYFWNRSQAPSALVPLGLTWGICILFLISALWVFAVQALFIHPVSATIRYSFAAARQNGKETVLMLIVLGTVLYFVFRTPGWVFLFFYLNFGVGLTAYPFSVFYTNAFRKYIPQEWQDSDDADSAPEG